MLETGYWIGYWMLDTGRMLELDDGDRILELVGGFWMPMPEILDTGDTGYWKHWMLGMLGAGDSGCW